MALTRRERIKQWKERTSETAAALKKAKATVSLSGKRSIPLSAKTAKEIRVAAWRAEHPVRTVVDPKTGKHTKIDTRLQGLSHREQARYNMLYSTYTKGQELSQKHQQELFNLQQKLKEMQTPGTPHTPAVTPPTTQPHIQPGAFTAELPYKVGQFGTGDPLLSVEYPKGGAAGVYDIFADTSEVDEAIRKMQEIGIPVSSKYTKRIESGRDTMTEFLRGKGKATADLGLLGYPSSKAFGAMSNLVDMFTGVPIAAEKVIKEPSLIGPGAVALAHQSTVGLVPAIADDPVQTAMEFYLMGKGLHMTQQSVSGAWAKSPIKIGTGESLGYKGAYVEYKGDIKPIIGTEKGKVVFGEPSALEASRIKGMSPEKPLDTYRIEATIKKHFSESDFNAFKAARDTIYETQWQASGKGAKFTHGTKTLTPDGTKAVVDFAKKNDAEIYGSFASEAQVKPGIRRIPGDIDINLNVATQAEANALTKALLTKLKGLGEPVRISQKTPTLIEAFRNGKWHHAVDLHYKIEGEYAAVSTDYMLGFDAKKTLKIIDDVKAMGLTEQVLRKGKSSVTPHEPGYLEAMGEKYKEVGIGPEAHRIKDIHDFVRYQEVLIDLMKEGPTGILKKGKAKRATVALEEFKGARSMFFDEQVKVIDDVKALMYKPETKKPSPSTIRAKPTSPKVSRGPSQRTSPAPSPRTKPSPTIRSKAPSPPSPKPSPKARVGSPPRTRPSPPRKVTPPSKVSVVPSPKPSPRPSPRPGGSVYTTPRGYLGDFAAIYSLLTTPQPKPKPIPIIPKVKPTKGRKKKKKVKKGVRGVHVRNPVPSIVAFMGGSQSPKKKKGR